MLEGMQKLLCSHVQDPKPVLYSILAELHQYCNTLS